MSLTYAEGRYPFFKTIAKYDMGNQPISLNNLVTFINNNYKTSYCLCKMKLYEKKRFSYLDYKFCDNYNNNPNLNILTHDPSPKNYLLALNAENQCYCYSSKYELINLIQEEVKKNENLNEKIENLEKRISDLKSSEKENKNKLQKYDEALKSLNELKRENIKLSKESEKKINIKQELENKINQLNIENQRLENEGKKKTDKLNDEIKKLSLEKDRLENEGKINAEKLNDKINKLITENQRLENEGKKKTDKLNDEIKKLNLEKDKLKNEGKNNAEKLNDTINKLITEKARIENEDKKKTDKLNDEIKKLNLEKDRLKNEGKNNAEKLYDTINKLITEKQRIENEGKDNTKKLNNEINKLNQKILNDNKDKNKIIENLKKDYNEEIQKLNDKKEELENKCNEKINILEKEKNALINDQQNLNNKLSNLKKGYENQINKLNNENEINKKNYENKNKQNLEEINKIKNEHLEEIEKLNKEKEDLKKAGELLGSVDPGNLMFLKKCGLVNNIELNSNVYEIDSENRIKLNNKGPKEIKFEDFYDLIVNIKSIKDIEKGWELKMNEKGLENYHKYKKTKVIKIGIIGNSNKGKSFILSKLSIIPLPSGADIRTEGLSVKYPDLEEYKNRHIVLLDSAGLETPVLFDDIEDYISDINQEKNNKEDYDNKKDNSNNQQNNENLNNEADNNKDDPSIIDNNQKKDYHDNCEKAFKEKSKEKIMTELFLQNYIMHNCDILILVVGILTYSEQKLINRIKTEMKNQNIQKKLFIIHNLILYDTVEKVEKHIQNTLLKCATFQLEKAPKIYTGKKVERGVHYYEKNSKPVIYHLIMANDISEAGEEYNPYTIKYIQDSIQYLTDLTSFDIIETLKERFITLSKDYFENPISKSELMDNKSIFQNKRLSIQKCNKGKIDLQLKCCLIDELGFSNFKGNGFIPKYNYFQDEDKICLRVEVPGNYNINCGKIKHRGEYTIIPITGEKKRDKIPQKIEDNIFTTREFGKFEVNIYLQTDKYDIKTDRFEKNAMNGVAIFTFELQKEKEFENADSGFNDL